MYLTLKSSHLFFHSTGDVLVFLLSFMRQEIHSSHKFQAYQQILKDISRGSISTL